MLREIDESWMKLIKVEEGAKKDIKGKTYYVMSGDYSAAFLPEIAVY